MLSSSLFEPQSVALRRFQQSSAAPAAAPSSSSSSPAWLNEWERQLKCGNGGDEGNEGIPEYQPDGLEDADAQGDWFGSAPLDHHSEPHRTHEQPTTINENPRIDLGTIDSLSRKCNNNDDGDNNSGAATTTNTTTTAHWQVPGLPTPAQTQSLSLSKPPKCTPPTPATTATGAEVARLSPPKSRGCAHTGSTRSRSADAQPPHPLNMPSAPLPWEPQIREADLYAAPAYAYFAAQPQQQPQSSALAMTAPSRSRPHAPPRGQPRFSRIDLLLAQQQQPQQQQPQQGVPPSLHGQSWPLRRGGGEEEHGSEGSVLHGDRARLAEGLAFARGSQEKPSTSVEPQPTGRSDASVDGHPHEAGKKVAYDSAVDYDIITGKPCPRR